ncbi:hypothetical protein [Methanosarcina sp. UBA289]|uniref:hypothetical protein n=1 Tax=Methanosarcina sp. UBA289 TaxID=1915574 RepID=UPI0025F9FC39|nr:hypothetical protein [Methanosarcina sp. UBA289]
MIKNPLTTLGFDENLISKPYLRDQPAQRLWHKPFQKRLDRKPLTMLGFDENLVPKPVLFAVS